MITLKEGHRYELANFESPEARGQEIQFIEKLPVPNSTDLETISDGTTNEEVLMMLIDRMKYLQGKFGCRENAIVITKLEESLMWLNHRTADRQKRNTEGKHEA